MTMRRFLPHFFLSLLLSCLPLAATATDYTDIWWNPLENGWGVNLVQSDAFIFATFFVYGADNLPTWVVANLSADGNGNYTGDVFATTGPYYGTVPYDPTRWHANRVGTATFTPTAADTGVLSYEVNGIQVVKNIERQTLTAITLGGSYTGGQGGAYTRCANSGNNGSYKDTFDLQVTQQAGGSVSFAFSYAGGLTCTLSGTLQQRGQLYSVPGASYQCSDGLDTSASMAEIKATSQGIEGTFSAPSVGGGCREDAQFSAVLL